MRLDIDTKGRSCIIKFSVLPDSPKRIRIVALDANAPLTRYTDRFVNIRSQREFEMRLPLTPQRLSVFVTNVSQNNDVGLKVSNAVIQYKRACSAFMDSKTSAFVKFIEDFCQKASYLETGVYKSRSGNFTIKYLPTIIDYKTGKNLNTPARIGHETGNIEVAKDKWLQYSVPMRICILLHEYSHKYINPKIGREINDEVAADINALYLYLGMGFPPIDARLVFAYVFYGNATSLNKRRMNIIDDYITRFQNGEVIKGCS